jgi:Ca2+-binding EF-hand superfamily protein
MYAAAPTMTYGAAMEPVEMAPMSAFDAMDTNHDGVISRHEFMQMQR